MLSVKRILVAEDNEWIAAGLVDAIASCDGVALGPAQTTMAALALIHELPDGAILDANLLDGPITPVARALCVKSVPAGDIHRTGPPLGSPKVAPRYRRHSQAVALRGRHSRDRRAHLRALTPVRLPRRLAPIEGRISPRAGSRGRPNSPAESGQRRH